MRQGCFDEAIAAYEAAVRLHPADADAYQNLGILYLHLRQDDAAIAMAALRRVTTLNPTDHSSHRLLGFIYALQDRPDAAAMELAAGDDEYGRACFASVSGEIDAALALLDAALAQKQLTFGWARIDPEFVFLQDEPWYKALLRG